MSGTPFDQTRAPPTLARDPLSTKQPSAAMPTKEPPMSTNEALALISHLVSEGHSATYIANALNLERIPSPRGRKWAHAAVKRECEKAGLKTPSYDPSKHERTPPAAATAPKPAAAAESNDIDTRDAAITQYADEMRVHRWLVAQAVEDFEHRLDELALWIEHGPQEPDPTGDDDADRIAHKEARRVWMNHESEEAQLRAMIAGKDDVTAVELIFVWSCERIDHHAAMTHARTKLEANYSTPEREELRKRQEARDKLYRAAEPKRSETLGELVTKAERAMRARRAAMAQ